MLTSVRKKGELHVDLVEPFVELEHIATYSLEYVLAEHLEVPLVNVDVERIDDHNRRLVELPVDLVEHLVELVELEHLVPHELEEHFD